MTLERRKVEKSLAKKGFCKEEGGKHTLFHYWLDGRKTGIWTKVSRGTKYKTLGHDLVKEMADQCSLKVREFRELIACPMTKKKYADLVRPSLTSPPAD